jgi:hypothetical protein
VPTPFDFVRQQALKAGSKALRDALSGARQLPEELGAAAGIVRNALSNVREIPVQAAEALRLGPATSRIAREAYGGSGATRGGLLGTLERTPVPRRAPVPAWTGEAAESASGYPKLSPTSSVNPNYYPSSVNPNYAPSSVNPNYFPSSVNKNYFPDPEFRSIDPSSAAQLRLDLRAPKGAQASRPYTTSKGAERPEGTNVGGQYYRPDIMVRDNIITVGPRGEGGNFRADVGTQDVIRQSLREAELPVSPSSVRTPAGQIEMFSPTGAVMFPRSVGSSPPTRGGALVPTTTPSAPSTASRDLARDQFGRSLEAPVGTVGPSIPLPGRGIALDPSVDDVVSRTVAAVRSPGLKFVNLNDPTLQRLLLGGLGVGSFAAGITAMQSEGERKRAEGQMPMTNAEEATPSVASIDQLQAEQAGIDMRRALAARLFTDESGRPLAESGNGGASQAQEPRNVSPGSITTNGDRRETARAALAQSDPAASMIARAMEPRDPSSYKSAADYFAAEREYAQQQGMRGLMRQAGEQLAQRMQTEAQLGAWAEANPHLMYRLQQQQLANPAMNQQSGQSVTTREVTSPMGPDPSANAIGYGVYKTDAEMGDISANDLAEATRPLVQPKLSNLPDLIQQRLRNQAAMRGGI